MCVLLKKLTDGTGWEGRCPEHSEQHGQKQEKMKWIAATQNMSDKDHNALIIVFQRSAEPLKNMSLCYL